MLHAYAVRDRELWSAFCVANMVAARSHLVLLDHWLRDWALPEARCCWKLACCRFQEGGGANR